MEEKKEIEEKDKNQEEQKEEVIYGTVGGE